MFGGMDRQAAFNLFRNIFSEFNKGNTENVKGFLGGNSSHTFKGVKVWAHYGAPDLIDHEVVVHCDVKRTGVFVRLVNAGELNVRVTISKHHVMSFFMKKGAVLNIEEHNHCISIKGIHGGVVRLNFR